MGKYLHNIEILYRKALEGNEENPSQKAWDAIEKKLDNDNVLRIKRKYTFLKYVAFLLVLLVTGLGVYVWKYQDKAPGIPDNKISGIHEETRPKNGRLSEESSTTNFQKPVDSLTVHKSSNPKQVTESDNGIIDKTILKNNGPSFKNSLIPKTSKNLSNTLVKINKVQLKSSDEVVSKDGLRHSVQKPGKLFQKNTKVVLETRINNQIENRRSVLVSTVGTRLDNNTPALEKIKSKKATAIKSNTAHSFAIKESFRNMALAKINPIIPIGKSIVQKPSLKSITQSRFAITAFYSPDIVFNHFINSRLGNSNNINFTIPESESQASTIGSFLDYTISKHWGLQSGITLARTEYELEYEKPETLYAQPDNSGKIQFKLNTPLGDAYVKPSFSNNPNIGDSIYSKSTAYNLHYIGIPLAIKYNLNKGKFTLSALVGVSANFLTRGRITTELEYGNDNETEITDKIYGLKSEYFNGLAGIGVDYNIYKSFFLSFSPAFRFALNATNSGVSLQSYPNSLGFILGLKMKL